MTAPFNSDMPKDNSGPSTDGETASPPTRFVILHHVVAHGEHWDFMIEQDDVLVTWQLAENPLVSGRRSIPAHRIADHRRAYLDYEGPVSRNRGTVRRIERGTCIIRQAHDTRWHVLLSGKTLRAVVELRSISGTEWQWQRSV